MATSSAGTSSRSPLVKAAFDVRVQGLQGFLSDCRQRDRLLGHWRRKRRFRELVDLVNKGLQEQGLNPQGWSETAGKPVVHIRIDRGGILAPLRQWAAQQDGKSFEHVYSGKQDSRFVHLLRNREREGLYLPVDFPDPIWIRLRDARDLVPVGSSLRLQKEVEVIAESLPVDRSFRVMARADFMEATEKDVSRQEARYESSQAFWLMYGFALLEKLVKKSCETTLPILFSWD